MGLIKLPPTIKTKWVAALRSGKYKQDTGRLRTADGFCCLGVLCDITKGTIWTKNNAGQYTVGNYSSTGDGIYEWDVSKKVYKVLEQEKDDENTVQGWLADKNDENEWSFKKIASWIEKNL